MVEPMPPVVGLLGKAGAGKDTFYRLVLAPRGYVRLALADPIRGLALGLSLMEGMAARTLPGAYVEFSALAVAGALLGSAQGAGVPGAYLDLTAYYYTWYGQQKSPEVRRILQRLGTEVGQGLDPGLWLYATLRETKAIVEAGGRVAITDLRFPHEAAALKGDTAGLRRLYEGLGRAAHPLVREALTRTWHGGGLVVPRGMGVVIRVRREEEGLEGELGEHPSEKGVEEAQPDHEVAASSLLELKAAGDRLFGPVEAYLSPS